MSQFTNYAENQIADYVRGQGLTLPASWWAAGLTAASDASVTESVGLDRFELSRALASWAGTQGDATTLASSGTSHTTSNNIEIDLGIGTTDAETLVGVGLFDASTGGNCWAVWLFDTPLVVAPGDPVTLVPGIVRFTLGLTSGVSDYLSNKLIDRFFRGQAYAWPATIYHAAYTATPGNAGGGTEVGGGVGYARAALVPSLASLSGTQAPASTIASSGTGGRISNNAAVAHPAPTGDWGVVVAGGWHDAATGGNLLLWHSLASPITVSAGSPAPTYQADAMGITIA